MKITKRAVDAAKPSNKLYILWDADLKGFGLQVLPTGTKSYVFQYKTSEGRTRRLTIGKHGAYTPDQARKKADQHRHSVLNGGDPAGQKRALLDAVTAGQLLDAYLGSEAFKEKAPSTQAIDRGRVERHLRPLLGARHAHLLTDEDIKRALTAIRNGKTATDVKTRQRGRAIVRGGAGTARMAIDLLRAIFNWGVNQRVVKGNPCTGVKTGTSGTREAIIESAADYARLFQALDRMEQELRIRQPVADAIRLIALTGCRRGEAAGLRWSFVDLKRGRLVLPPTAHKTGRKTGKPREITLPAAAQAIVARQPQGGPNDFVFVPAKGNGSTALSKAWRKVCVEAGLELGLHGLRHSVASHLAMGGAEAAEIMTAMGHRQLSTVQRYIHFAETARHALAERAATVALAGMTASHPGEVVRLKVDRT